MLIETEIFQNGATWIVVLMVLVSLADVSARLDGKAMFALSKLVTPDVPLMACAPMGLASVQTVRL